MQDTSSPRTLRRMGLMPFGVQRGLPADFLARWSCHYEKPYSHGTSPRDIEGVPSTATHVFVGARSPDGTIALGAIGSRDAVLRRTEGEATHEDNCVHWYFAFDEYGEGLSFGFSRTAAVDLSAADTLGSGHSSHVADEDGHYRLSWHLDADEGGWRAGQVINLTSDHRDDADDWKKLLFWIAL
jgi:hypothetical protein